MALLVKTGGSRDLPEKPENWPICGDFNEPQTKISELNSHGIKLAAHGLKAYLFLYFGFNLFSHYQNHL